MSIALAKAKYFAAQIARALESQEPDLGAIYSAAVALVAQLEAARAEEARDA